MIWLCGDTHVGQKRAANQDVFFAEPLFEGALLMVCDGMGGEQGGETASRLAMEAACAMLKRDIKPEMGENTIRNVLECAGAAANSVVFETACNDPTLFGMGTTMTGAVLLNGCAHFIHAGDSRAYLLRDDMLTRLTVDHTYVQHLLSQKKITEIEAVTHPDRHKLIRAVGVEPRMRFDIFSIDLLPNDAVLLCSDGLYNYIDENELAALAAVSIKAKSVESLINRANANGGGDNITAVLCHAAKEGRR